MEASQAQRSNNNSKTAMDIYEKSLRAMCQRMGLRIRPVISGAEIGTVRSLNRAV